MSKLSSLVTVSEVEKPFINFESSLDDDQVVSGYVPVKSTLGALEFLKDATAPHSPKGRAVVCWGTYGTGKSRLCSVIARLFRDGFTCDPLKAVWERLERRGETALLDEIRRSLMPGGRKWRPWLVVPMYAHAGGGTISSALIRALVSALKRNGLDDSILGQTVYHAAARRLEEVLASGAEYLPSDESPYSTPEQLKRALQDDLDEKALTEFKDWHTQVTHGVHFENFLQASTGHAMEACEVFGTVAENIGQHGFDGIVVIWDEFGFAVEQLLRGSQRSSRDLGKEVMELQEFLERACGSSEMSKRVVFMAFTHVGLSEYGTREGLDEGDRQRLDTVSKRFREPSIPIRLGVTEAEGYHLLAGMMERTDDGKAMLSRPVPNLQKLAEKMPLHSPWARLSSQTCYDEIVTPCYPLHPATCASLLMLSDQVAQQNRTTFYFLQDSSEGGLAGHLQATTLPSVQECGGPELLRVNHLFRFFEQALKDSKRHLYEQYEEARARFPEATDLDVAILEAVLTFLVIASPELTPSTDFLSFCLFDCTKDDARARSLHDSLHRLAEANALWQNAATGIWGFVGGRGVTSEVRKAIDEEVALVSAGSGAELLRKYSAAADEITDLLGDFNLDPCSAGTVRRIGVRLLDIRRGDQAIAPVNPALAGSKDAWRAAVIYLVACDTIEQIEHWSQYVTEAVRPGTYFVVPPEPLTLSADRVRELIGVMQVLGASQPGSHVYDVVEGELTSLRNALRGQFEAAFGNEGLRSGAVAIRGDEGHATVAAHSWDELLSTVQSDLEEVFGKQIQVRCGTFNEWREGAGWGPISNIVQRLLEFDEDPRWAAQLLGFAESKQEAAIIDGVLVDNGLLTKNELSQKWELMDIDDSCPVVALRAVAKHLTSGGTGGVDFIKLYQQLISPPFGVPNGVIPLLLALGLRLDRQRIVIYRRGSSQLQRVSKIAAALVEMAQHPRRFETRFSKLSGKQRVVFRAVGPEMGVPLSKQQAMGERFYEYCEQVRRQLKDWASQLPEGVLRLSDIGDSERQLLKILRTPVPPQLPVLADVLVALMSADAETHQELIDAGSRLTSFPAMESRWRTFSGRIDRHVEGVRAPVRSSLRELSGSVDQHTHPTRDGVIDAFSRIAPSTGGDDLLSRVAERVVESSDREDMVEVVTAAISDKTSADLTEEDYGKALGVIEMVSLLKSEKGQWVITEPSGKRRTLTCPEDAVALARVEESIRQIEMESGLSRDVIATLALEVLYGGDNDENASVSAGDSAPSSTGSEES